MSLTKIIIAATSGLAAGVVIGLLAAPQSGAETRQQIADGVEDLKKKIVDLKDQAMGKAKEYGEEAMTEAENLKNNAKEKAQNFIDRAKSQNHAITSDLASN